MIRSSKIKIKNTNNIKINNLNIFINEYKIVTQKFIDLLWDLEKIPSLIPIEITSKISTWLSARMVQCSAKQASGIVRGTKKKQNDRLYRIKKLKEEGNLKQARKLQNIYDKKKVSKPTIKTISPELDSRFITIDLSNHTSFEGWITISSIGNKMKIHIPFNKTNHFNKWFKKGKLKEGIRISNKNLTFMFEIEDKPIKTKGDTLGIDVGLTNAISCSNGFSSKPNNHGHTLKTITDRMNRKKKGSKGFKREQEHRKNYINWSINQLNLKDYNEVKIENIKNLRKGKRCSKSLSRWTYTNIFDKLIMKCEEEGVLVSHIDPTYTSQRCSVCGWTKKSNRRGKRFRCTSCGFESDADLNASRNIALDLPKISRSKKLKQINRKGFYWSVLTTGVCSPCCPKAE